MSFTRLLSPSAFCGALFLLFNAVVNAQIPAPLATPDLKLYTNGTVNASVRLADGSVIFGGSFSRVNGVERHNLARLNAEGSLDANWSPSSSYPVKAVVADGKGNVYIGGNSLSVNNQVYSQVAKLSASGNGTVDPNWNSQAWCINFYSMAVNNAGDVFVGGSGCFLYPTTQTGVLKLSGETGAQVASWKLQTNGYVTAMAVDSDDNLYIGGTFSSIGGQSRKILAKVSSLGAGDLDSTWNPAPTCTTNGARVYTLLADGKGSIYVGGMFDTIGTQTRSNLAKLSTTGSGAADTTWNPSVNGTVKTLAFDAANRLYVGGAFTAVGGQTRYNLARLNAGNAGTLDTGWNATTDNLSNNAVNTISILDDNGIYAGGFFSTVGGSERHSFTRIDGNGTPRTAVDTIFPYGTVRAIVAQPNGGIVVGGYFSGAGSLIRSNLLRILPNGNIDPNWSPAIDSTFQMGVEAIAADAKNNIYVGGDFTQVGDQKRIGIARVSATGVADPAWGATASLADAATDGWYLGVEALALSADGSVYFGGDFATVGGQPRHRIAKMSAGGTLDASWSPSVDDGHYGIQAISVDQSGAVFIGGDFSSVGGQSRGALGLAKLLTNGNLDSSFNSAVGVPVTALQLDGKGSIYAANNVGIFKLSASDGSTDINWKNSIGGSLSLRDGDPYSSGVGVPPHIHALALDPNGNLFAGGVFGVAGRIDSSEKIVDERTRPYLAKFSTSNGTSLDLDWNPIPDEAVYSLMLDGKGSLYAGGVFSRIGTLERSSFASIPASNATNANVLDHLNQFGWTGAWYNPATSGQGILVQIIPSQDGSGIGTLFGGWFTYDPPYGNPGTGQRWYTLQGPVDVTSRTASVSIYANAAYRGPSLPSGVLKLGDAVLTFDDCTHASLTYWVGEPPTSGTAGAVLPFAFGTAELTRLGGNPSCTSSGDTAYSTDFSLSGGWYDPTEKYSGLIFDVDPPAGVFFAAWYRNFFDGNSSHILSERWYTLQSPYTASVTSLQNIPIYQGTGGVFDTPSKVSTAQVGTANLVFKDCANATLNYNFTSGPEAGTSGKLELTRGVFKPSYCNP